MPPRHHSIAALGGAPWCERSRKPHAAGSPRHRCLPSSAHQTNPNATPLYATPSVPLSFAGYVHGVARTAHPQPGDTSAPRPG